MCLLPWTIRWADFFNGILIPQEKIELSWGLGTEPCASSLEKLLVPRKQHSEPFCSTLWISQEILARIFAQWVWSLFCLTQNYFSACIFLGKIGNSHRKSDTLVSQSLSHVQLFVTPWTASHQASLSITNSRSLLNLIHRVSEGHPTISSSIVPLSSYPQSFPASGSFPMSHFFASGSQNIGASASATILPKNIQGWFPLGLTNFMFL